MPPKLASLLTWAFIIWLFRRDAREKTNATRALWIPFAWLVVNMSRYPAMWLRTFGIPVSASEEGTPVDALYYAILVLCGLYVLMIRGVTLQAVISKNFWLIALLAYALISIGWSDFPIIAAKRWIKTLGHPIVALVVLTEPDPKEAVIRLFKRLAYVVVPVSVLFIKYYPEWGRGFSDWTGEGFNTGITTDKNALGYDCFILGFFFVWYLLQVLKIRPTGKERRNEFLLCLGFLSMITWLMNLANSKTSLTAMVVGICVVLISGFRFAIQRGRRIGLYLVAFAAALAIAEPLFDLYGNALRLLGRNPTLTDRVFVWQDVLAVENDPLIGTGFESFWMGERNEILWAKHPWRPNQAHNGYLEMYINLGAVGLTILLLILITAFWKASRAYETDRELGRFRLGFVVAVVLYNWTEASFKALHPVWSIFYLVALEYPTLTRRATLPLDLPETRSDSDPLALDCGMPENCY